MNMPSLCLPTRPLSLTRSGLVALCLFFAASWVPHAAADEPRDSEPTSLTTLRSEVRNLLRQEATLDPGLAKDAAGTALCDLYVILRNDERFETSEMLRGDAAKVRRRLLSIAKRLENQLKREGVPKPSGLAQVVDEQISHAVAASESQQGSSTGESSSSQSQSSGRSNATSASTGNSNVANPNGAHAPGPLPDTGWQLVELIQRVVAPDFWDSRGGPGTIRYFAMRRVLVVRATSDVHEQIRDLLMALH